MFEPEPESPKIQFRIIGIASSPELQICRCYTERLFKSFPQEYEEPDVRPVLDVEWHVFLSKIRRKIGGEKLWALQKQVAVFKDGEFLGDDMDLLKFVAVNYRVAIFKDFDKIGKRKLVEHLTKQSELGRNFVYFTIAVDDRVIGSILFLLYSDLVPSISEIFMRRCKKRHGGYAGTPIQRIVIPSWIQCGGWELKHHRVPCENYVVPHDRRGVLSMCHKGKHTDNSTQIFITLDPTPWMDYKYVAFGQLIHGEEILRYLEKIPTHYEAPTKKIQIVKTGEFNFYPAPDPKGMAELERYLATKDPVTGLHEDVIDPRDAESVLFRRRYKRGMYSAVTDMQSYLPFLHLPEYLIYKYLVEEQLKMEEVQEEYFEEIKELEGLLLDTQTFVKKSPHLGHLGDVEDASLKASASDEKFIREYLEEIFENATNAGTETV